MDKIKQISVNGTLYEVQDENALPKAGGTVTGNLTVQGTMNAIGGITTQDSQWNVTMTEGTSVSLIKKSLGSMAIIDGVWKFDSSKQIGNGTTIGTTTDTKQYNRVLLAIAETTEASGMANLTIYPDGTILFFWTAGLSSIQGASLQGNLKTIWIPTSLMTNS